MLQRLVRAERKPNRDCAEAGELPLSGVVAGWDPDAMSGDVAVSADDVESSSDWSPRPGDFSRWREGLLSPVKAMSDKVLEWPLAGAAVGVLMRRGEDKEGAVCWRRGEECGVKANEVEVVFVVEGRRPGALAGSWTGVKGGPWGSTALIAVPMASADDGLSVCPFGTGPGPPKGWVRGSAVALSICYGSRTGPNASAQPGLGGGGSLGVGGRDVLCKEVPGKGRRMSDDGKDEASCDCGGRRG